ncbi:hypothetical protein KCP78_24345 [Salmonella enterica subsp. enterica]|nr:hypothetical protein KCP78_24345 [Salmonella enterica subsp. enterica]
MGFVLELSVPADFRHSRYVCRDYRSFFPEPVAAPAPRAVPVVETSPA